MRGAAVQCKQIQTRWPSRLEKNDNNKLIHLNNNHNSNNNGGGGGSSSSNTRNVRRRRSSGGIKSVDTKYEWKGDARSQRKCRSNEFHPSVRRTDGEADSARDSDTNLLIENMRNRECELFNKISENNGYYCCSSSENDDLIQLIRRQNSRASVCDGNGGGKRKSPANKAMRNSSVRSLEVPRKMTILNQSVQKETRGSVIQYQTEASDTMRKLKFTITINRNYEKQTCGFQRIELNSNSATKENRVSDPPPVMISDTSENCNTTTNSSANGEYDDLSSSINTVDLDKSAEYYDCCEPSLENQSVTISSSTTCSSLSVYEDAMDHPPEEPVAPAVNFKAKCKQFSIVQELTADNKLHSSVIVDGEPRETFNQNQLSQTLPKASKSKRFTIIGDSFCNEVFRSLEQRNLISNVDSRYSASVFEPPSDDTYSMANLESSMQSDKIVLTKLDCKPKYTGRSIGRLLAARLERNQALGEKRKMLLKTMAVPNKLPSGKPPAKPPRSFTSLSSPSSNKSSDGVISATTIAIGDAFSSSGFRPQKEYFEPSFSEIQRQHDASTQIGWFTADKEMSDNCAPLTYTGTEFGWTSPKATKSLGRTTKLSENSRFGWVIADTTASKYATPQSHFNQSETRMEPHPTHILGMLNYDDRYQPSGAMQTTHLKAQPQHNAVAPFENIDTVDSSAYFERFSNEAFPCSTPIKAKVQVPTAADHPPKMKLDGAKKPNAAIAFLGASKKFLKNATLSRSPRKDGLASAEKSKKNSDDTAKFNSDDFDSHTYEKKTVKHLGFTPKKESPPRQRPKCEENFARSAPPQKTSNGDPKKTATVLVKLNRMTKTPRKMLRGLSTRKPTSDPGLKPNLPSEHFYKSFNGSNGKVPLMRELLGDLRHKVTGEQSLVSPARRSLRFQDNYASSEDLDDMSNRIVEIDLHDAPEPEPLYAEVNQQNPPAPSRPTSSTIGRPISTSSLPVDIKEIFISSGNESEPPRKYLMVNNDPSVLYATVKNKPTASSLESLDINIVNNFADSVQNMIDRKFLDSVDGRPQSRTQRDTVKSPSLYFSGIECIDSESDDISDRRINGNSSDITSLDTFQTENLYETIVSETDLNDEIRHDIHSLERSPTIFEEMSDLEDDSFCYDGESSRAVHHDGQKQYPELKVRIRVTHSKN